jgi:hypothetical protein
MLAARGDITLQRWDSFVQDREREERDGTRSNTEELFHTSDMMCWAQNFDLYSTLSFSHTRSPFSKIYRNPSLLALLTAPYLLFALYTSILTSHPTLRQSSHPHPSYLTLTIHPSRRTSRLLRYRGCTPRCGFGRWRIGKVILDEEEFGRIKGGSSNRNGWHKGRRRRRSRRWSSLIAFGASGGNVRCKSNVHGHATIIIIIIEGRSRRRSKRSKVHGHAPVKIIIIR